MIATKLIPGWITINRNEFQTLADGCIYSSQTGKSNPRTIMESRYDKKQGIDGIITLTDDPLSVQNIRWSKGKNDRNSKK